MRSQLKFKWLLKLLSIRRGVIGVFWVFFFLEQLDLSDRDLKRREESNKAPDGKSQFEGV